MNDEERFEAELKRVAPACPPAEFMARLKAARPVVGTRRAMPPEGARGPLDWARALRWLAAATAVVAVAAGIWRWVQVHPTGGRRDGVPLAAAPLRADGVQIDQELISSFDAVARLPSGEPIRFRCREWLDQVVVRDRARGLTIAPRAPRVELVPVRFETY